MKRSKTMLTLALLVGLGFNISADAPTDPDVIERTKIKLKPGALGFQLLTRSRSAEPDKPSVAQVIGNVIDTAGIEAGERAYWHLRNNLPGQFNYEVSELNNLGYDYLRIGEFEKALAVLNINALDYPEDYLVYHRLGETYFQLGDKDKAITNYTKSVELNPNNLVGLRILKHLVT